MMNKTNVSYQTLKVSELKLAKYQRAPQLSRVKQYASTFDANLIGVITVSFRDGAYWVVDGQHRLLVLKAKQIFTVMCEIHHGLTYEQEAALFEEANSNRKAVSTMDRELALIEANDEIAVLISKVVDCYGFRYGRGKGRNTIAAINSVKQIHKAMGIRVLHETLGLIKECWDGITQATDAEMLLGVALFVKNNSDFDRKRFLKKLSNVEPKVILREGKSDISDTSRNLSGYNRFEKVITKYYEKKYKR